ncbi:MAG: hypothetical protein ABSB73_12015, partial [Solirubrobacteraceae bacterium]
PASAVSRRKARSVASKPWSRSAGASSAATVGASPVSWAASSGRASSEPRSSNSSFSSSAERSSRTWATGSASHAATARRPAALARSSVRGDPREPGSTPARALRQARVDQQLGGAVDERAADRPDAADLALRRERANQRPTVRVALAEQREHRPAVE